MCCKLSNCTKKDYKLVCDWSKTAVGQWLLSEYFIGVFAVLTGFCQMVNKWVDFAINLQGSSLIVLFLLSCHV